MHKKMFIWRLTFHTNMHTYTYTHVFTLRKYTHTLTLKHTYTHKITYTLTYTSTYSHTLIHSHTETCTHKTHINSHYSPSIIFDDVVKLIFFSIFLGGGYCQLPKRMLITPRFLWMMFSCLSFRLPVLRDPSQSW